LFAFVIQVTDRNEANNVPVAQTISIRRNALSADKLARCFPIEIPSRLPN